jgi:hypothetical protein
VQAMCRDGRGPVLGRATIDEGRHRGGTRAARRLHLAREAAECQRSINLGADSVDGSGAAGVDAHVTPRCSSEALSPASRSADCGGADPRARAAACTRSLWIRARRPGVAAVRRPRALFKTSRARWQAHFSPLHAIAQGAPTRSAPAAGASAAWRREHKPNLDTRSSNRLGGSLCEENARHVGAAQPPPADAPVRQSGTPAATRGPAPLRQARVVRRAAALRRTAYETAPNLPRSPTAARGLSARPLEAVRTVERVRRNRSRRPDFLGRPESEPEARRHEFRSDVARRAAEANCAADCAPVRLWPREEPC